MSKSAAAILGAALVIAAIIIAVALLHHGADRPCGPSNNDPFGRGC